MTGQVLRRQIRPGLLIDHLGTLYRVESFDREANLVAVLNPITGYQGEIPAYIITARSRHAEEQRELVR
jgi:hypothetical protein